MGWIVYVTVCAAALVSGVLALMLVCICGYETFVS